MQRLKLSVISTTQQRFKNFISMNTASQKMGRIQSVFIEAQLFYANNASPGLPDYLEKLDPEFRSVGYESISMAIALKDFETNNNLQQWQAFAKGPAIAYKAQVYIGLGWAVAKKEIDLLSIIHILEPLLLYRLADGCGYYDGTFRQRKTLVKQELPVYLPNYLLPVYYQGIGRSFWYLCKTGINNVCSKIESFPSPIHEDMWRGVGTAVAYVGGCDVETLNDIYFSAAEHRTQLGYGAALAVKSRNDAGTFTTDTYHCFRHWFELLVNDENIIPGVVYENWINKVEEDFAKRFIRES
ncbi:MAG TPA: DUF1702 family protein [Ferruginibacter sp.]|nr:DUF1702 family protein [Ferruginibacter sp.]